jgi:hypothetical protein
VAKRSVIGEWTLVEQQAKKTKTVGIANYIVKNPCISASHIRREQLTIFGGTTIG